MEDDASKLIDKIINTQEVWKSNTLANIRMGVLGSDSRIFEEVKWRMKTRPNGWPVWSYDGILCFAEVWNDNIKLLFPKGVHFAEDDSYFNARLKSKDIRAIEFKEKDPVDLKRLQELVIKAVQYNTTTSPKI